jgi:L-rhamnose mutarotase
MQKFSLALDLKDDPALIAVYEKYHEEVWPEVIKSITDSGIIGMEIYRVGNRLFMIMEANDDFSFAKKAAMDNGNFMVNKWEDLMWVFQQPLPFAKSGEKWMVMQKIFDLASEKYSK